MKIKFLFLAYSISRTSITKIIYIYQFFLIKKKDLEPAVKFGDKVLSNFSILGSFIYDFPIPKGKHVEIFELTFPSPLIGASFKSEPKILQMWMRMGLGGSIYKTIMANQRFGNPYPRLQDVRVNGQKGILNALGLPGPGIDFFLEEVVSSELWEFKRPLGISIGGENEKEYIDNIKKIESRIIEKQSHYFYELNISCPNTDNGVTICQTPEILESLLLKLREFSDKVVSIKVSPDVSNEVLFRIGEISSSLDKIIINAGNTKFVSPTDVNIDRSNFSMAGGGLSGAPIFARTLEMVSLFSKFDIPIMATGGISNIDQVKAAKHSGASLFGLATGLVLNPYCIPKINSVL